jgi:hypothetical protein
MNDKCEIIAESLFTEASEGTKTSEHACGRLPRTRKQYKLLLWQQT